MKKNIQNEILETVATSTRGMIMEVTPDNSWLNPFGVRCVTVQTPGATGPLPRTYLNVPWPYNNLLQQWAFGIPKIGDYVMIGFKGGSSELPYVQCSYSGKSSISSQTVSQTERASVPSQSIISGITNPTNNTFNNPGLGSLATSALSTFSNLIP